MTTKPADRFAAPEVLLSEGYGKEVDLWTVGVILYIM
jgi:serine/threonine protein kinase